MSDPVIFSITTSDACFNDLANCEVILSFQQDYQKNQCVYRGAPSKGLSTAAASPSECTSLLGEAQQAVDFENSVKKQIELLGFSNNLNSELLRLAREVRSYVRFEQGDIKKTALALSQDPKKLAFARRVLSAWIGTEGEAQQLRFNEFINLLDAVQTARSNRPVKNTQYPKGTRIEWQESQVRERDCPEGNQTYTYIYTGSVAGDQGDLGCESHQLPVTEDASKKTACVTVSDGSKIFKIPPDYKINRSIYATPQKSKCIAFVPVANFTAFWPVKRFSEDFNGLRNLYAVRGGMAVAYPKYHSPAAVGFIGGELVASTFKNQDSQSYGGPSFGGAASFGGFKGSAISFGPSAIVAPVFGNDKVFPVLELGINSTLVGLVSMNVGCQFFGDQAFGCGLGAGFTPLIFGE